MSNVPSETGEGDNRSEEERSVERNQQLHESTIERLRLHGHKMEARGCVMLAGDIDRSEHTLHMVRNGLDKNDPMYAHKVAFLNASIKILQAEQERLMSKALIAWNLSRVGLKAKEDSETSQPEK